MTNAEHRRQRSLVQASLLRGIKDERPPPSIRAASVGSAPLVERGRAASEAVKRMATGPPSS